MDFEIAGKLFPNLLTLIVQLCATGILFYFVKKLLWTPTREYLEKRSVYMQSQLTDAETQKQESEVLLADAKKQLNTAGKSAKEIVERGKTEGQKIKDDLVKDAQREAEMKLENARDEIEHERQQMRESLHNEIVEVAMAAAEKLIEEKIDSDEDRSAIERFVKEVSER